MLHLIATVAAALSFSSPADYGIPGSETTIIPFTIDEIFGSRPVVSASINGHSYKLVLHSNAGSYLQINHAEAVKVGARDLQHRGAYGISAPGQVSKLGRDDGTVDRLEVGDRLIPAAPVAVFEVPAGGSEGMLGLPFLHENKAIVDFSQRQILLPKIGSTASIEIEMARRGYTAHKMVRDAADGRFLVTVSINGVSAPMVVSTVASVEIDTAFAQRAGVEKGKVAGVYGGPSGATGEVYDTAQPIALNIDRAIFKPMTVSIVDTFAYSGSVRPAEVHSARGGALGADFMIENGAVIDFGNAVLYLKK